MARVIHINPDAMVLDDAPPIEGAALRVPPHSVEAEHGVLGAILQWPAEAMQACSEVVSTADFYRHEHRLIYGAAADLAGRGVEADMISVFEELQQRGQAEDIGGLAYLNQLYDSVSTCRNTRRHAEIMAERATLRALIAASDQLATAAFNPGSRSAADLFEETRTRFAQLQERRGVGISRRLPVLTGPELEEAAESMTWLVDGILPEQTVGMMFGASGTFKSFLALDAAMHIVHGLPWLGRRTTQGPVLWLAAEGGISFGHRAKAWRLARRLPASKDLIGIPVSIDLGTDAWRVVDAVQSTIGATPRLVVIDTLSQTYTAGAEENSATDMAAYLREIGTRFRDLWKCVVMIIHHNGHSATERPRGSSAIQANTAFLFGCWRDEKEMMATLSCQHMKDGDRFDDMTFAQAKIDLGTDKHGKPLSHLAARHLSSAEDIQESAEAEVKAGRGGHGQLLLSLLQNGSSEADLKKAFFNECGLDNDEARRKAYYRARKTAIAAGHFEVAEGHILTRKAQKR